jgi:putative membrane protein
MIIRNNIPLSWLLFYNWKSLLILNSVAVVAVLLKKEFGIVLNIPTTVVTILSAALSIYLGFRSNNAYDRWWEARTIWGAVINYSRSWSRQVQTFIHPNNLINQEQTDKFKQELIYRHIAFVNALRVFLRGGQSVAHEQTKELFTTSNTIADIEPFISEAEFELVKKADNPPNMLLDIQGRKLEWALREGLISDYRLVHLDQTLVEFNNVQGRSERIKNTAFPRSYSYFQRVFVWTHGLILPFAYVKFLNWSAVPVAFLLNYVFLAIDFVGSRTEDPFENRYDDVPLTAICKTIERNLKESLGEKELPEKEKLIEGILF